MTRVLVTGANGFVGAALCARLSHAGYEVCGVVRRQGSAQGMVSREVVIDDVGPDADWREALEKVSMVVHLAARVHVMRESEVDHDALFRRVNVDGSRNLAEQAAAAGVRRFIYVSSIKVNGEETALQPFRETDTPSPQDSYARSKLAAEEALLDVADSTGMDLVVVRPPLVYGPGVKGNMMQLISWVARGYPLPFGAICNHRSLIALDNLVDLLELCLEHPGAAGQVFLAADGTEVSTSGLIQFLAKEFGRKPFLISVPSALLWFLAKIIGREGDVGRLASSLQVDASKAREVLGWLPPVAPDQALADMIKWYRRSRQ